MPPSPRTNGASGSRKVFTDWNTWMYDVGPLVDLGLYNLKSLTSLLGPVVEVTAAETTATGTRLVTGTRVAGGARDVIQLIARHERGALSSVIASWEIHGYRRPALELYGRKALRTLPGTIGIRAAIRSTERRRLHGGTSNPSILRGCGRTGSASSSQPSWRGRLPSGTSSRTFTSSRWWTRHERPRRSTPRCQ